MKRKLFALILALVLLPTAALAADTPYTMEAPVNLTAELKKGEGGVPYFELKVNVPQSVRTLADKINENGDCFAGYQCSYIELQFDYKYGNYDWNEGPSIYWTTSDYVTDFIEIHGGTFHYSPFDSSTKFEDVDIKSEVYQFRVRFEGMWGYTGDWTDKYVYSPYSNTVTIGNPAFWSASSDWAQPELQNAQDAGLIPDILKGADMTKPISREEFCELAVLLYEKTTGKTAETAANPFTDTQNPRILKAVKLGITNGTSSTTFEPKKLINRQECATMLFRAIKAIKPDGDYVITGVPDFADQRDISEFAVVPTKYMSKLGIIKGDNGNFMPKANPTVSQASNYGMATREAAVLMTVRTYEKVPAVAAAPTPTGAGASLVGF